MGGSKLAGEDEAQRAHQRRLRAEGRGDDARGRQTKADVFRHRFRDVVNDERPRAHDGAADDDRLRAESLNQIRDADA